MTSRVEKRKRKESRRWALRQYERHLRHNRAFANPGEHGFVIILDNLKPSYNIGKIFRSGDGFGAHAIHLIGIDYFEVKSAKGAFKWVPASFHSSFLDCYQKLSAEGYALFTLEPEKGTELFAARFPRKSGFIFGHEEYGFSFEKKDFPAIASLTIPQVGRGRSLNVSVAASVVMYEYFRQQQGYRVDTKSDTER